MQTLFDFLSFKSFISPSVLLFCYYLGALGAPMLAGGMIVWMRREARARGLTIENQAFWTRWATHKNIITVSALFVLMFVCMEIGWRMMFEFMLAYFQMREALLGLS